MFDVKAIRDNPAWFDGGLTRRGLASDFSSTRVIALDDQRKKVVTDLQDLQGRRNSASKEIGKAKGAKDEALAAKLMAEVAGLKDKITAGEAQEKALTAEIETYLAVIPNIPLDEVPVGADETGNREVRRWGDPKDAPAAKLNKPKQHFELGEALGMMDFETAQKVSGARFVYLKGGLARLERALGQFMLDIHTEEFGYTEVVPPMLVGFPAGYGTGNLPKFETDLFEVKTAQNELVGELKALRSADDMRRSLVDRLRATTASDQIAALEQEGGGTAVRMLRLHEQLEQYQDAPNGRLFLVPTAEIPLTNLAREQIIDEDKLPMRFTAWTPCFRSEAGAAGRDTRGMIRQHQFSKVELVSITTPEKSLEEHERMTLAAETVLQRLGLAYRTLLLCTGDMGFASQKTYDLEVWLPGQDAYREISSCSLCGDFQARRMGARYRPKGDSPVAGGQPKGKQTDVRFTHTLNGSGLAVGRTLVAVLENYQQADGSIAVPPALIPYMGGKTVIAKA